VCQSNAIAIVILLFSIETPRIHALDSTKVWAPVIICFLCYRISQILFVFRLNVIQFVLRVITNMLRTLAYIIRISNVRLND